LAGRAIVDDEADLTDAVSKNWMLTSLARDGNDIFLGFYNEFYQLVSYQEGKCNALRPMVNVGLCKPPSVLPGSVP
jgi:hypothetical protein